MEKLKVLRLRLELETNDDAKDVLRKYGKAKEGISREFVVPSFLYIARFTLRDTKSLWLAK